MEKMKNSIIGENFRHLAKISSLLPNKVFPDKITIILPYP